MLMYMCEVGARVCVRAYVFVRAAGQPFVSTGDVGKTDTISFLIYTMLR